MLRLNNSWFVALILGCLLSFSAMGVAYGQDLFGRNLRMEDQGEDVQLPQVFLNNSGTSVANTGVGSRDQETTFLGPNTQRAVAALEEIRLAKILAPAKLVRGAGSFFEAPREAVHDLVKQTSDGMGEAYSMVASMRDQVSSVMSHQPSYIVGGTVTGLKQPVEIREASGEVRLIRPGDAASFAFTRRFAPGERYQVTVASITPGSQACYVSSNGTGTITDASISTIQVQCVPNTLANPFQIFAGQGTERYLLGGTVSGLTGAVVLESATGERLALTANGPFTFGSRVTRGDSYLVTVRTNPSGPDQTCTVTNGSGTMGGGDVTNVGVTCVANVTTLSASVSELALSAAGLVGAPLSGSPRVIMITNTGSTVARDVAVSSPTWPAGTVSATTCGDELIAGGSCAITVTPGGTATSDGASPCSAGSAPVPGVVQVAADNSNTVSINVVVLGYGCIYQEGYVFSIDDTTPATQSIGGTVAALENQSNGMVWASNGVDASSVSYDLIPGIGDTSLSLSSAPTFAEGSSYFGSTYVGVLSLTSGSFSSCQGNVDGRCNTANIVAFYDHYQTNYGIGGSPYTPVTAPTPKSYYAAGVCDEYDSGEHEDWYLPAICQVTFDYPEIRPETASCGVEDSPLMQTIMKNLFFNEIGDFTSGQGLWSSSLYMYNNPETYAWNALVWPTAFPGGGDKSDLAQVRCVRSLTHE